MEENNISTKEDVKIEEEIMAKKGYVWVKGHTRRTPDGKRVWVSGYWKKIDTIPQFNVPTYLRYISPSGSKAIDLLFPKKKRKKRRK